MIHLKLTDNWFDCKLSIDTIKIGIKNQNKRCLRKICKKKLNPSNIKLFYYKDLDNRIYYFCNDDCFYFSRKGTRFLILTQKNCLTCEKKLEFDPSLHCSSPPMLTFFCNGQCLSASVLNSLC